MKVKTFSDLYDHKTRTVQWYLLKFHEELDRENIIYVENKEGKRKKYDIIDAHSLDIIIRNKLLN